ncbi:hypothetical protein OQA88_9919 [Cercophora sp. LCS_1]
MDSIINQLIETEGEASDMLADMLIALRDLKEDKAPEKYEFVQRLGDAHAICHASEDVQPTVDHCERLSDLYGILRHVDSSIEFVSNELDSLRLAELKLFPRTHSLTVYETYGVEQWPRYRDTSNKDWRRWRKQTIRANPSLTLDTLQEQIGYLQTAKAHLLDVEAKTRAFINQLSRPRRLSVLDLPDDVLMEVCELLAAEHDPTSRNSDIGSLRQVCHRFNGVGSRFLCPVVTVTISEASIQHLERISQHALIRHSVRTIRFDPYLCDDRIPLDVDLAHILRSVLEPLAKQAAQRRPGEFRHSTDTPQEFSDLWQLLTSNVILSETWRFLHRVIDPTSNKICEDFKQEWKSLQEQFEKYQRFVREQQSVLKDDAFYRKVASAIAKMPSAGEMQFLQVTHLDRRSTYSSQPSVFQMPSWSRPSLEEEDYFVPAGNYRFREDRRVRLNFFTFLTKVLNELKNEGAPARAVEIQVRATDELSLSLAPLTASEAKILSSAVQEMKRFSFLLGSVLFDWRLWSLQNCNMLFQSFFASPSLRELMINIAFTHFMTVPGVSPFPKPVKRLGQSLAESCRYLQSPSIVEMRDISFSCSDLGNLLQSLKQPRKLVFRHTRLLDGRWSTILDIIRKVDCPSKRFRGLSGAEGRNSDGNGNLIFPAKIYAQIFHHPDGDENLVHQYINGTIDTNPLSDPSLRIRPHVEGTQDVQEDDGLNFTQFPAMMLGFPPPEFGYDFDDGPLFGSDTSLTEDSSDVGFDDESDFGLDDM